MRRGRSSEGLACTTLAKACFNFFKNGPLLRNRHGIRQQLHAGATRAPAGQAAEHMDSLWRHPNAYFGDVCSVLAYSHRRTGSDEHAAVLSSICNNQRRVTACSEMQHRSGNGHLCPVHAPVQKRLENCTCCQSLRKSRSLSATNRHHAPSNCSA